MIDKGNSEQRPRPMGPDHPGPNGSRPVPRQNEEGTVSLDPWALTEAALRKWYWIFLACGLLAAGAYLYTDQRWRDSYRVSVQLVRFEMPNSTEYYKPRQLTDATFANFLRDPELLKRIGAQSKPPMSADAVAKWSMISPTRDNDIVVVMVGGTEMQQTIDLANLYATEATKYTKDLQRKEAREVNQSLTNQLAVLDRDMENLNKNLVEAPANAAQKPNQVHRSASGHYCQEGPDQGSRTATRGCKQSCRPAHG
jgi:hypothetical protein